MTQDLVAYSFAAAAVVAVLIVFFPRRRRNYLPRPTSVRLTISKE